jgi:bifunctional DNA-binding transcriptional regulator/antitoxin component of YhaV-PrlF toxin-antitoxin module
VILFLWIFGYQSMDREYIATVDAEGHADIPPDIRERHGMGQSARVKVEERGKEIVLTPQQGGPKTARSMRHMVGILGKDPKSLRTLMEERLRAPLDFAISIS